MARMSIAASLMGAAAATLLSGCASQGNTGTAPQAASSTAACSGNFRPFGEAASQNVSLTCSGIERNYVAYPESIAHRYSSCAYTLESASTSNIGSGNGRMTCSNGRSGTLTYKATKDPASITVVATLDDGREMAFTLRDE
jgi:hypothetical protein